jgi:predicted small lipoprotein YifL
MKRFILSIAMLALVLPLAGCGSDSAPGPTGSNDPAQVKEFDARRQAERERTTPKAP